MISAKRNLYLIINHALLLVVRRAFLQKRPSVSAKSTRSPFLIVFVRKRFIFAKETLRYLQFFPRSFIRLTVHRRRLSIAFLHCRPRIAPPPAAGVHTAEAKEGVMHRGGRPGWCSSDEVSWRWGRTRCGADEASGGHGCSLRVPGSDRSATGRMEARGISWWRACSGRGRSGIGDRGRRRTRRRGSGAVEASERDAPAALTQACRVATGGVGAQVPAT